MNKWQIVTSVVVALVAVLSLTVAAFARGRSRPWQRRKVLAAGQWAVG